MFNIDDLSIRYTEGGVNNYESKAVFYTEIISVDCETHTRNDWEHDYVKHWETCSVCNKDYNMKLHEFVSGVCECGLAEADLPKVTMSDIDLGTVKLGENYYINKYVPLVITGANLTGASLTIEDNSYFNCSANYYGNRFIDLNEGDRSGTWSIIPKQNLSAGTYKTTITFKANELIDEVSVNVKFVVEPITFTFQKTETDETGKIVKIITEYKKYEMPECDYLAPESSFFECCRIVGLGNVDKGRIYPKGIDYVFIPTWVSYVLTATFIPNGGTLIDSRNIRTNDSTPEIEMFAPSVYGITTPSGKVFCYWALGSTDGEKYYIGDKYKVTKNENIFLYAIWDDFTYTVNFDAGRGTGGMASVTGKKSFIIPESNFVAPKGMVFDYFRISYEETKYRPNDVWAPHSDGVGVTLVAVYKDINFTIRFNANGGSGVMDDINGACIVNLSDCKFIKPEGMKNFKCWAVNSVDGETYNVGDSYYPKTEGEVTTFYAVWQEKDEQAPLVLKGIENLMIWGESVKPIITGGSGNGIVSLVVIPATGEMDDNAGNGTLSAVKVGTVKVKAVKEADQDYKKAESNVITVNITPKKYDSPIADTREFVYNGEVQKYNIGNGTETYF